LAPPRRRGRNGRAIRTVSRGDLGRATVGAWLERQGVRASRRALAHSVLALRDSDLRPALATIGVPTAIFHARADRICPFAFAEEMARGIRGATIVPFEHSRHGLFPEEPDKFHRALIDFIG
jgi:pimeloyl-ACP methyl ester carboxylesterase